MHYMVARAGFKGPCTDGTQRSAKDRMARAARRANQGVNIQAVAERAGVSAMTVSNVVSGRRKVREATRDAVLAAVEALGYVPNIAAQALASAGTVRLGLLCSTTESAFLSSILVGVLDATTALGAQLLLRRVPVNRSDEIVAEIVALAASGVSAILIAPPYCEAISRSGFVHETTVPLMAMSPGDALPNMRSVGIDDFAAARDMTRYLIGLGHRRVGFIRAAETHIISHTRQAGYRAALEEAGLGWSRDLAAYGDLSFESGLVAAEYLLDLPERPTAIFASNDDMAAAVVSLAHRRAIRVPEDLSVVGFDDSPIAVKIWPPLTTMRQPIARIAARAATLVIQGLRARGDDASVAVTAEYLPYELVERESTARLG